MTEFYSEKHRAFHDTFDTRRLADRLESRVMRSALAKMDKCCIEAIDMFFLSSVDHNGWPTAFQPWNAARWCYRASLRIL